VTTSTALARRRLLLGASGFALAGLLPGGCAVTDARGTPGAQGTLVLVELQGGNDGLNTVVPHADPAYARLRPRIAIPAAEVLDLDGRLGLHPSLAALGPAWRAGEVSVVLGVGYPQPNRSHFRSIEIWDTASDADRYLPDGWASRALALRPARPDGPDAVVFGRPYAGPLAGPDATVVSLENPADFGRRARAFAEPQAPAATAALDHVLRTHREIRQAGAAIAQRMQGVPEVPEFPRTGIGGQLRNAARLLSSGIDVPVVKVSHGSFDTHVHQRGTHDRLLRELAEALDAFRATLAARGLWDGVLVATYSEFGRRAAENSGQGTDHGTAAPMLLMGRGVRGGLHGRQPSLDDLDREGDLRHTADFRQVFAEIARKRWGLRPDRVFGRGWDELRVLA
jgi:uncharacterized protein (DUF1501 family)